MNGVLAAHHQGASCCQKRVLLMLKHHTYHSSNGTHGVRYGHDEIIIEITNNQGQNYRMLRKFSLRSIFKCHPDDDWKRSFLHLCISATSAYLKRRGHPDMLCMEWDPTSAHDLRSILLSLSRKAGPCLASTTHQR